MRPKIIITRRKAFENMLNDICKMDGKTKVQFNVRSLLLHQAVALVKSEGFTIVYLDKYYLKKSKTKTK